MPPSCLLARLSTSSGKLGLPHPRIREAYAPNICFAHPSPPQPFPIRNRGHRRDLVLARQRACGGIGGGRLLERHIFMAMGAYVRSRRAILRIVASNHRTRLSNCRSARSSGERASSRARTPRPTARPALPRPAPLLEPFMAAIAALRRDCVAPPVSLPPLLSPSRLLAGRPRAPTACRKAGSSGNSVFLCFFLFFCSVFFCFFVPFRGF